MNHWCVNPSTVSHVDILTVNEHFYGTLRPESHEVSGAVYTVLKLQVVIIISLDSATASMELIVSVAESRRYNYHIF